MLTTTRPSTIAYDRGYLIDTRDDQKLVYMQGDHVLIFQCQWDHDGKGSFQKIIIKSIMNWQAPHNNEAVSPKRIIDIIAHINIVLSFLGRRFAFAL